MTKQILIRLHQSVKLESWISHLTIAIPRITYGLLLTIDFVKYFSLALFLFFFVTTNAQKSFVKGNALQKDSLIADLQLLEQALTELHPGLYRYNTPEDISSAFQQLKGLVYEGISEAEFMKMLAQTIVKIKCGHTYLNPWNMKRDIRNRLFGGAIYMPVGFKIIEGQMILTHNASNIESIKRGAAISSINGIPVSTILDSLGTIAKMDGNNTAPVNEYLSLKNYNVRSWQAFDLYFPLFFPMTDSVYTIEYQNYGELDIHTVELAAMTKKERAEKMGAKYGTEVMDNSKWSLDLSHPGLAVMRLGTFAIWNWKDFDQQAWFKTAFDTIQQLGITHLAIDIRGNGGGLAEPRIELTSYLVKDKLACDKSQKTLIRMTKINPALLPYIDTWNEYLINGLPKDFYAKYDDLYYELTIVIQQSFMMNKHVITKSKI